MLWENFNWENKSGSFGHRGLRYDFLRKKIWTVPLILQFNIVRFPDPLGNQTTKYRANFITLILIISGRSTKKSPYWVKQMVAKSSHKLSPKLVIIPSPKLSPIPADPQKNHPMGWNKKWQNCHMNFHQIRWSYHHLNYHQFWQIPPKITIMGEIKSDKIVTRIVTKFGDIFVTLILTISGSSPKKSPYWVKQ